MCVYVSVHVCVSECACVYVSVHVCVCAWLKGESYILVLGICVYVYVCVYVCARVCVRARVCVFVAISGLASGLPEI